MRIKNTQLNSTQHKLSCITCIASPIKYCVADYSQQTSTYLISHILITPHVEHIDIYTLSQHPLPFSFHNLPNLPNPNPQKTNHPSPRRRPSPPLPAFPLDPLLRTPPLPAHAARILHPRIQRPILPTATGSDPEFFQPLRRFGTRFSFTRVVVGRKRPLAFFFWTSSTTTTAFGLCRGFTSRVWC